MASRAASASPAEIALQDDEMLALQALPGSRRVSTLSVPQGEVTSQGMVRAAERVEHLDIERIVGRRGDGAVEGEVGLAGRLAERQQPFELEERLLDRAPPAALLRRMRRKAGALDLDAHAHLEHVERHRDLVADVRR